MQQYLTLEEAAKILRMSPDELREMAKKKTIRAFQDRGSWRFRAQDIEEMARARGLGSDPELQLGEGASKPPSSKKQQQPPPPSIEEEDDVVSLGNERASDKGPRSGKSSTRHKTPKPGSDSDVRLVLDSNMDFAIDLDSDVKVEPSSPPKDKRKSKIAADSGVRLIPPDDPSDSDVKLEPSSKDSGPVGSGGRRKGKNPSDSDIRLEDLPSTGKKGEGIITEEIDLDAEQAEATKRAEAASKKSSGKHKATQMGNPLLPQSSPFELSEPDFGLDEPPPSPPKKKGAAAAKADTDSSSDFELIPFDHDKSLGGLGSGEILLPDGADADDGDIDLGHEVSGPNAGQSGINLRGPVDSGISLESGGSDDEIEFELSLDSGVTPKPSASSGKSGKSGKSAPANPPSLSLEDDSSSEFELSLDDSSAEEAPSDSEFELTLDDDDLSREEGKEVGSGSGSDSEFELTLDDEGALGVDDEGAGDIFEETNFDVPALDDESGSEAVALDEADTDLEGSDFEINLDDSDSSTGEESDSQVVALDDEEEIDDDAATVAKPRKAAAKGKKAPVAEDDEEPIDDFDVNLDEEDAQPKKGKKGKKAVAADDEDDVELAEDEDEDAAPAAVAAPAEWGALPAVMLLPTVVVMFVVGLMGFELIRGMWGYQKPTLVGKPIIDTIARQFDDTLPK